MSKMFKSLRKSFKKKNKNIDIDNDNENQVNTVD
jgi:hypothetical protein